jgi:hypothetical protein
MKKEFIITIVVALLVTACSGVQSNPTIVGYDEAAIELIDEETHPPQEMESLVELFDYQGLELPKSFLGNGNPRYANSEAAGETGATKPDIGSPQYSDEFEWLDETLDNTEEVVGC